MSAVLGERTCREPDPHRRQIRPGQRRCSPTCLELDWLEETRASRRTRRASCCSSGSCRGTAGTSAGWTAGLVTVAQLRELGRQLLNIHGQHDGQQLLDPACHSGLSGPASASAGRCWRTIRTAYQQARRQLRKSRSDNLKMDEAEKRYRRVDTLTYQIAELERADLTPGEDEELAERQTAPAQLPGSSWTRSRQCQLRPVRQRRGPAGGAGSARRKPRRAMRQGVARYSDASGELAGEAGPACGVTLDDAAELRAGSRGRSWTSPPAELDQLEEPAGHHLPAAKEVRHHGRGDAGQYLERCRAGAGARSSSADDTLARLETEAARRPRQEAAAGGRPNCTRPAQETGGRGSQQRGSRRSCARLGHAQSPLPGGSSPPRKPGPVVWMRLAWTRCSSSCLPTWGRTLKPIQKVASGGELARIMLALKNVLAEDETSRAPWSLTRWTPACPAGRPRRWPKRWPRWPRHKQVLCVTHLPQIAAMADTHFSGGEGGAGRPHLHPGGAPGPAAGGRRSWHVSLAGRSSRTPS